MGMEARVGGASFPLPSDPAAFAAWAAPMEDGDSGEGCCDKCGDPVDEWTIALVDGREWWLCDDCAEAMPADCELCDVAHVAGRCPW